VTNAPNAKAAHAAAQRREAIMRAAFDVFMEKGFEATTTLEIVRRAKTSKRALYELFATKQDILTALVRYGSQRMQAPPDLPPPASQAEFLATLERFGTAFLSEFLDPERMALYRLAITEGGRGGTVARELDAHGRLPVLQSVTRYFERAAERGIVAREATPTLIYVFFSVLIGISPLQLMLGTEPPVTRTTIANKSATATMVLRRLLQQS
jgi:AcrR family transcriptional regulator